MATIDARTATRLASVQGAARLALDDGDLEELEGVLDEGKAAVAGDARGGEGGEEEEARLRAMLEAQGPLLQRLKELRARASVLLGEEGEAAPKGPAAGRKLHVLAAYLPDTSAFVQVLEQYQTHAARPGGLAEGREMLALGPHGTRRQPRVWVWTTAGEAPAPDVAAEARAFAAAADGVASAHIRRDLRLSHATFDSPAGDDAVASVFALMRPAGAVPPVSCPPRDVLDALLLR